MPARRLAVLAACFTAAVVIATALGSVVQTQFNAAAIVALGVPIPLAERLSMTLDDLLGFTPIYGAMVAITLLLALPVAALPARIWPRAWPVWFAAAGGCGILVAFAVADALLPMPTFVAATRSSGGTAAMMASAALGSAAFGVLWRRCRAPA